MEDTHLLRALGGVSNNSYELLNLRALKIATFYKNCVFQCMGKISVWNFKGTIWNSTQNILTIHWKMWKFKSSSVFEMPPGICMYGKFFCMYLQQNQNPEPSETGVTQTHYWLPSCIIFPSYTHKAFVTSPSAWLVYTNYLMVVLLLRINYTVHMIQYINNTYNDATHNTTGFDLQQFIT